MPTCPHCGTSLAKRPRPHIVRQTDSTPTADPRLPSNAAAHVDVPFAGDRSRMTATTARKARLAAMQACPCRLCALALRPPRTLADADQCWPERTIGLGRALYPDFTVTADATTSKAA